MAEDAGMNVPPRIRALSEQPFLVPGGKVLDGVRVNAIWDALDEVHFANYVNAHPGERVVWYASNCRMWGFVPYADTNTKVGSDCGITD